MDEAETRRRLIDERLRLAGWDPADSSQVTQELDIDLTGGATSRTGERGVPYAGHQFADYPSEPTWPRSQEATFARDRGLYVATYPTMLKLVRAGTARESYVSPHFFDLVIADESHRSLYDVYS